MSEVLNSPTPGTALLCAAFKALTPGEQAEALRRCQSIWLEHEASRGSETARMIASLSRVAEILGESPGIDDYKRVRAQLQKDGEQLEPVSQITRHFNGSWHMAREALDLSDVTTPRRIESRFRKRKLGKIWRYTEETLVQTMADAVEAIGQVPQVAQFDWWRQRQIELAEAQGDEVHLPSPGAYRRRWGSWEKALLHLGYTPDEVSERLERR